LKSRGTISCRSSRGVAKIFSPRQNSDINFSGRLYEDQRPRPPYKRRRRGFSNSSGSNSSDRGSFDRDKNYSHRYFSSVAATAGRKRRLSNNMSGSGTGSEHGRGGHGGGGGAGDLASRTLVLESKRFYLDVKENSRGRFIKIAEISADGRKNQILMTLPTAAQFRQHLVAMIQAVRELAPVDPARLQQGELRSEVMFKEDKKYHIDLKENARGRFLKVSETFTRGYSRFQIFIPADGMEEFNLHLKELIEEYDDGEIEEAASAPENRHVRIENKNFFFSCKKNAQGRYITVAEIKGNFRNTILIPESGWDDFRDVLDDYVKQCKEHDWKEGDEAESRTVNDTNKNDVTAKAKKNSNKTKSPQQQQQQPPPSQPRGRGGRGQRFRGSRFFRRRQ